MQPEKVEENDEVKLTCRTTCPAGTNPTYIWYKDKEPFTKQYMVSGNTLTINSPYESQSGSYTCALEGHEGYPSPAVCKFHDIFLTVYFVIE